MKEDILSQILSVSEITNQIRQQLEINFQQISIEGEISNFKPHVSGHWYFTLKDSGAQISCTMWKGLNNYVFFKPQDGMKIIANGRITIYPQRGNYQLDVKSMKIAGEGELQAAFERLKKKLYEEGLFEENHKKEIPQFSSRIGIVTAKDGAAFQDMISIASRRYPLVELVIRPARVQGEGAAEDIVSGIQELNKTDVDLIIIGRGGGSLEDLWAFNEEIVAREIFKSKIPIISAVGHEIDYTISDFVADKRSPTPSAAMEIATPNTEDLLYQLTELQNEFQNILQNKLDGSRDVLNKVLNSYGYRMPQNIIKNKMQYLDNIWYRLESSVFHEFEKKKNKIEVLSNIIDSNNMVKIQKKGYAIIKQNNSLVTKAAELRKEKHFLIKFYDDEIGIN
ncbi:MAG: exodeoxyribonuclease VII large subunit [Ignavibacteriales bacterium CG_4_9_14_3_um_filter_34_10]|nr:MAG: exodeoxyribonuclease VII large subunit [Ignavibacteriales bacterium CG_4_9_14_3_um_filter_34_10]